MDKAKTTPTYTLYGEFSANNFRVESGAKKQSYGSLSMYYDEKDTDEKVYASYLGGDKEGEVASRSYKYNCATSQFYVSLSKSETATANYCTFATLDEDSVAVLEDFQAALTEFIEAEYGANEEEASASEFVTERKVVIDADDPFVGDEAETKTFKVPNSPIVIKKVSVKKY
jgi:cyclophilin family peptidyl-prolyl cis-trans isomerase